jgi:hypothetical protein
MTAFGHGLRSIFPSYQTRFYFESFAVSRMKIHLTNVQSSIRLHTIIGKFSQVGNSPALHDREPISRKLRSIDQQLGV